MALKIKRAGEAEYGFFIKAMIAGEPGSGKTRSASSWPNVLYANVEGGLMSVADRNPAYTDITSTGDLKALLAELKQAPTIREKTIGIPVDTICIDTFDEIAKMFMVERQRATGHDFQRDDWGWLGDELRGVLRGFRNLDMHVIINVHLKTSEDQQTGSMIQKAAIQGAVGDEIAAYFDLALLLRTKTITVPTPDGKSVDRVTTRHLQTYQDLQHPWIKDRSGRLPAELEVNFDDDFVRMHELIYSVVPQGGEDITVISVPETLPPAPKPVAKKAAPKPPVAAPQPTLPTPPAMAVASQPATPPAEPTAPVQDTENPPSPKPEENPPSPTVPAPEQGSDIPDDQAIAEMDETMSPAAVGIMEDMTVGPDGIIPDEVSAEIAAVGDATEVLEAAAVASSTAVPEEPVVDGPGLAAPPAETETAVEITEGYFHSDTCPKGQAECLFDADITPISEVRYDKGQLCRQCFADVRAAG